MRLPGKKVILIAVVAVLALLVVGYRTFLRNPSVVAIVVEKGDIRGSVHGPGTVQSKVQVTVSTKITGIITKLYADQGDKVRQGQLLAELDSAELRAKEAASHAAKSRAERDLGRAKADLVKAKANLALAQSNYQRDLEVFTPGYISQAAFDATKTALGVAESDVAAQQAAANAMESAVSQAASETHAAEALSGYTRIVSPMDGIITVRKAEGGDTVSPGAPIFQMVNYQIWAASWIDETKIAQLREGQKAVITLRSGRIFPGEVIRLNKEADSVTRELEVDVLFDTLPSPLVIGEETEVDIDTGVQTAPVVPLSAITERNGTKGVLVISDGITIFHPVVTGLQDGQRIAVPEGIKEGDMVIINPAGIEPGRKIKPVLKPGMEKQNR